MKHKQCVIGLAIALGISGAESVGATDLSYNIVEAGVLVRGYRGPVRDQGLRVRGSFEVANNVLVTGEAASLGGNGLWLSGGDYSFFSVGAGYVVRLSPMLDIVTTASIGRVAYDTVFNSYSDWGFTLASGVRGQFAPQLEGFGRLAIDNYGDTTIYLEGGALYQINKQWSIGGEVQLGDDHRSLTAIGRYTF